MIDEALQNLNNHKHVILEMFDEMDNWPYAPLQIEIRKGLRRMFLKYNTLDTSNRERLDRLITQHKQYCNKSRNTSYMRQHNTFVLFYINGISLRQVSRMQAINIRTACKDLNAVLDRMIIYLLGFYGIRWDKR